MPEIVQTKRCSKCKDTKRLSEFNKNRSRKDGLQDYCKSCQKILSSNYQKTPKFKLTQKRYRNTDKARENAHKRERNYSATIKGHLAGVWHHMIARCYNPKLKCYKNYGGRGIKLKFASLNEFRHYVMSILKVDPRGLTVDRIDNDGNYEKGNIRFVTRKENNQNKRKKYKNQICN